MSTNNKNIMQSEDKRLQASTEALHNMKTIKVVVKFFVIPVQSQTFFI